MALAAPADAAETRDAVAAAATARRTLELRAGGSKAGQGGLVSADGVLDLAGLAGIVDYAPEELVLTARPGTPLAEVEAVLGEHGQQLAFEPPGAAAGATLGGAVAANDSGPRRIAAGAARDHVLGVAAVSGRGEAFKSGGRVVKNVTGYDLPKLMAGSWGTLAAVTELTVKVLPAPESVTTVLHVGLDAPGAVAVMALALAAPHEVSGLAHLPADAAARSAVNAVAGAAMSVTALRVEGTERSVAYRAAALRQLGAGGEPVLLDAAASRELWAKVREAVPLRHCLVLWRLAVPPAAGAAAAAAIAATAEATFLFDWAGGRVWAGLPGPDALAERIHAIARDAGGHARLVRAPDAVRAQAPPFPLLAPALAALQQRVKDAFDPLAILNPGRMGAL